jgi:hypothetical protein
MTINSPDNSLFFTIFCAKLQLKIHCKSLKLSKRLKDRHNPSTWRSCYTLFVRMHKQQTPPWGSIIHHSIWDLHNGSQIRCVYVRLSGTGAKPSFGCRQRDCNVFLTISYTVDSSDQVRISEVGVTVLLHVYRHGTESKFSRFKENANVLTLKPR